MFLWINNRKVETEIDGWLKSHHLKSTTLLCDQLRNQYCRHLEKRPTTTLLSDWLAFHYDDLTMKLPKELD